MPDFRKAWRHFTGTTVYATFTTVLAALSALLGSVYAEDIRRSFPLFGGPYVGYSFWAIAFWGSLILFGVLFFERQRFDDASRLQLRLSTENIQGLVQTMPPKSFRIEFSHHSELVFESLAAVMPRQVPAELPAENLSGLIRSILKAIVDLAYVYDDRPDAVYAANVMLFIQPQSEGAAFPDTITSVLKFRNPDSDLRLLRGVLVLRQDLSTSTAQTEAAPDGAVPVIALPVPREIKAGKRWTLLPGAPKAFAGDQDIDGYRDSASLAEWCGQHANFAHSVQDELAAYFEDGGGKEIRSFISRRLMDGDEAIGVLNLHASRRDILGPAVDRQEVFHSMITPFFIELTQAVAQLRRIESAVRA